MNLLYLGMLLLPVIYAKKVVQRIIVITNKIPLKIKEYHFLEYFFKFKKVKPKTKYIILYRTTLLVNENQINTSLYAIYYC